MHRRIFLCGAICRVARAAERMATDASSLGAAIRAAGPGDTITMRDGAWRDLNLVFTGEGKRGRPITLRAQTPGKVLAFQDGVGPREVIAFRSGPKNLARFCRLTRSSIRDFSPPDKTRDTKWLSLYGSDNRVDHCYFAGKTNLGQTMIVWLDRQSPENRHRIDHNHFGPRPPLGLNGGESLRVGDSSTSMLVSRALVEENLFEACNGEVEVISNKSCENVYRGNRFEHCEGTLTLRHGNRCVVEGNTFLGGKKRNTGGIRIIGEDHKVRFNHLADLTGDGARAAISMMEGIPNSPLFGYFEVKRALVEGNLILNCDHPIVLGVPAKGAVLPPEMCVFQRNVVIGQAGPMVQFLDPKADVQWKDNVFFGSQTGIAGLAASPSMPPLPNPPPAPEARPGY